MTLVEVTLLRDVSAGLGRLRVGGASGGEDDAKPGHPRGKLAVKVDAMAEFTRRKDRELGDVDRLCV